MQPLELRQIDGRTIGQRHSLGELGQPRAGLASMYRANGKLQGQDGQGDGKR